MFDRTKASIKGDVCMKFNDETKPLYIETDASGVGLGQKRDIAILKEKHWAYYMALKNSTTIVLQERKV